jgi:hypothetical protein
MWAIRYAPESDLGRRFKGTPAGHFSTREDAENIRLQCANAESMESVEVDE